jgi:SAM-dependent methyltransferase/acyl carrier protein
VNQLAASAFGLLGSLTPPGRVLRVLEVGGGTGGTTSSLLPVLPADRTRYLFSDVSEVFLDRARERFAVHPCVEFGLFDLEQAPEAQGYPPASLDVIVAANAVHAARDLRATLARLRTMLAPGGLLILVESTVHLTYFDMTTGLIEGWQHFADDLRGDNPLLAPAVWVGALTDAGFAEARAWPGDGSAAALLGQHVIVARAPGEDVVTGIGQASAAGAPIVDPVADEPPAGAPTESWRQRLDSAMHVDRMELLRDLVRHEVMKALRLDAASAPARHDRLMDLGMDSLMAVRLRNALTGALGLERPLPSTLIFDHPTIEAIAAYLDARLVPAGSPSPAPYGAPRIDPAGAEVQPLDAEAVAALSDDDIERLLDERSINQ